MRSYDHIYLSVFDDLRGKWSGIILVDVIWIALFVFVNILGIALTYWLINAVIGPEGFIGGGMSQYFQSTLLSIPASILTGCFDGLAFYALNNTPLAIMRNPKNNPLSHFLDAFKDAKRAIISGIFYSLIIFAAFTLLRFWLIIAGIICIPLGMLSPYLYMFAMFILSCAPLVLYAYIYYSFCMVPNILYDYPDKLAFDAFRESKDLMTGFRLSLLKKHLPIILILAALGIGLGAGSYAMIGGAQGIAETQEMWARQNQHVVQVHSNNFEAKREAIEAQKAANTEPVPVYDPEKMTQREYIEAVERYKQRVEHRESEADLYLLQDLVDAKAELEQTTYAPTHHDDIVMARFKRTMLFLVLFSIFLICALPFFWAVQAEFYILIYDSSDKKMLEDDLKANKLKQAKDFMQRKTKALGTDLPEADQPEKPDKPEPKKPNDGPKEGPAQKRELRIKSDFNFGRDEASIRAAQHITEFTLDSVITEDDDAEIEQPAPMKVADMTPPSDAKETETHATASNEMPASDKNNDVLTASTQSAPNLERSEPKSLLDDLDFGSLKNVELPSENKDKAEKPEIAQDKNLSLASKFDFTNLGL